MSDNPGIEALSQFKILHGPPNERLDRLLVSAAAVFGCAAGAITLIDGDRVSLRSMMGARRLEKPRHVSFTSLVIEQDGPLMVPDVQADPVLAGHPAAQYSPGVRFLAGHALRGPGGDRAGAVIIWDTRPHIADAHSPDATAALADFTAQIEWELYRWELIEAKRQLEKSEERLLLALEGSGQLVWDWDLKTRSLMASARTQAMLGYEDGELTETPGKWQEFIHPDDRERVLEELRDGYASKDSIIESEFRIRCKDGSYKWVLDRGKATSRDAQGRPSRIIGTLTDIHARKLGEEERIKQAERMALAVRAGGVGTFELSLDSRVHSWDARMSELLGVSSDEFTPSLQEFVRIVHPEDRSQITQLIARLRKGDEVADIEFRVVWPNGVIRDLRGLGKMLQLSDDAPRLLIGTCWDVTEERQLQRQLVYQASHDALTGLTNRFEFERRLEAALQTAQRAGKEHALCFIDLDRFKLVNDTAGHTAGDMLLRELGRFLTQQIRSSDVLARLGGDEFGLLLHDCPPAQAEHIARELIKTVDTFQFQWEGRVYDLSISVGIVSVNAEADQVTELMSRADIACYAAKAAGRGRISIYRPGHSDAQLYHRELLLAADVREALAENRFSLHAQEIRGVLPGAGLRQYELLVRMHGNDGAYVMPATFISAAERYELMSQLDRWVLREALERQAPRIAAIPGLVVSINLSAQSLNDPNFVPFIKALIKASPLKPANITLEITETAAITHLAAASHAIGLLRRLGCAVALDDFGTGLSSFNYLKHFPVDYVKIDGSFICALKHSAVDRTIVEAIHEIARKLGSRTVAEYVEDKEIFALVREIGIDYAQGYGIGRPQPLDVVLAELAAVDALP